MNFEEIPMTHDTERSTRTRAAVRGCRLAARSIGVGIAVALLVAGAVVGGLLAVGIALFGAVRPTAASVSATSPGAARVSPHVRTKAPRTAADEAGR